MNADHFDTLTRSLTIAGSRRRALAAALSGTLGLLALMSGDDVKAGRGCKTPCGECQTCQKGSCKKTKSGKKRCKKGRCQPKAPGTPCTGGSCQGGVCVPACTGITCSSGQVCQDGICVNGSLPVNAACDPNLPLACSSGKCGCRQGPGGSDCFCRNATCGAELASCTDNRDCCQGVCRPTVDGFVCVGA